MMIIEGTEAFLNQQKPADVYIHYMGNLGPTHNPAGRWTDRHQLSIGGKRKGITRADLLDLAARMGLDDAPSIIDEVAAATAQWLAFADEARVPRELARHIGSVITG